MRILGKIGLLLLWVLCLSCDLLFNKPDGNLMQDIEDSVWDSNAPRLQVSIDYIAGAGTTNFAKGPIVPQPKQRIEFSVSFAANPDYGFVEWRAYKTGERPGTEEAWQAAAASLEGIVRFGARRDLSTTVFIDSDTGHITLEPFCVRRPEVDHSDPVWTGSSNRFYTNQSIRIWFTMPVDPASVENFDNISITALTYQGAGTMVDLARGGYFLPPALEENGTLLLIKPDMDAFPDGIVPNSDVSIRLDSAIRHSAFTDIDGGAGLRMARPFAIAYGTTGGPDKSVPQVLHIRGAEQETDQTLFRGDSLPVVHYRQNKAELWLLFNAYKPTETPIRDVRIYELGESEIQGTEYPVEELFWKAGGNLETLYSRAYTEEALEPPLSGSGQTKVRHSIRSKTAGRVRLYILPEDMLGNRVSADDAVRENYGLPVMVYPPPPQLILAPPVYNKTEKRIELRWTAPEDLAKAGVTLLKVAWRKNGVDAEIPNSAIPAAGDSRFLAGAWDVPNIAGEEEDEYAVSILALDGYGNNSLSEAVTVRADTRPPEPVTGFAAAYDSAARTIALGWEDPQAADLWSLTLSWTRDGKPAGGPETIEKGTETYALKGVPGNEPVYRFTISAADASGNESAPVEAGVSPGGKELYVPPVTGLAAAYDPAAQAITVGWTNPADTAFAGLALAWSNGAGVSGSVELGRVNSHTISGIAKNSGLYALAVTVKSGTSLSSVRSAQADTTAAPPPATGLLAAYDPAAQIIRLSWANPADTAFTGLTLAWDNGAGVSGSAELGRVNSHTISGAANDSGLYTLVLRVKDGASLSAAALIQANTAVVPPVAGLAAAYDPVAQAVNLSWTNPVETAFTGLTLTWDNGAGVSGRVELGKVEAYAISGVPHNSGIYTVAVTAQDGAALSTARSAQADTAVAPPPATGLAAAYDPAAQAIKLSWTNPADTAFTGLTLAWNNGAGVSGRVELGKVGSYAISDIAGNSGTYIVAVTVTNGALPSSAATAQADTALAPPPATGLAAAYDPAAQAIKLSWTNPAETAFTGLTLTWGKGAELSGSVELGKVGAYAISDIAGNSGTYTVAVTVTNGALPSSAATAQADTALAPPPAAGLAAAYDPAAQAINAGWTNPADTAFTGLTLAWNNGAGVSGSVELGKADDYAISGVPHNSGTYTLAVTVKNGALSAPAATAQADTAVAPPPPPPATGLAAAYDPVAQAINAGWTNPAETAFTGLTLAWDNGAGVSGSVELGRVGAYAISGIPNNSGTYTVAVRVNNGAASASAVTAQADTAVAPPPSVTDLLAAYDPTTLTIVANWTNPADPAFTALTLAWNNGAGVSDSVELGKVGAYAISGVPNNSGTYTVAVTAKNGTVSAPALTAQADTRVIPPALVDALDLTGLVVAPVTGAVPNTGLGNHAQYTGSVGWQKSGGAAAGGSFAAATAYQAVVSLSANTGYTFAGLGENVFRYAGASSVASSAGTGKSITVTIAFPDTAVSGLRYVKERPSGLGTGSSWDNASDDLQKMMDEAYEAKADDPGITAIVRVAAGTYTPRHKPDANGASIVPPINERQDRTFILRDGVELWGGYPAGAAGAAGEGERDWIANKTILSGDLDNNDTNGIVGNNAYHVVLGISVGPETVLNGFVITGGNAKANVTINISGNIIYQNRGGGIHNRSSSPVLTNVVVSGNMASDIGGGIYNGSYSPALTPALTNVLISGNTATNGGGIYDEHSSPVLTNVVIAGNTASNTGGGIFINGSSSALTNVTIAYNNAVTGGGINSNNSAYGRPKIRNSIIWGNSSAPYFDTVSVDLSYCIVQGGWSGSGTGNLDLDPQFVNPAQDDYSLGENSPAIDAGSVEYYGSYQDPDLSSITTDYAGAPRFVPTEGFIDMGAYERQP
jgi:hypothetical protein